MIFGDSRFALEYKIHCVYEKRSLLALGSYRIHLEGSSFGVQDPDATMLACSYDELVKRLERRGLHRASFQEFSTQLIVEGLMKSRYLEGEEHEKISGLRREEWSEEIARGALLMAPDGDAAFDDGSHVLQFDLGDKVRIIGFKNFSESRMLKDSIQEVYVGSDFFYSIILQWVSALERETGVKRNGA